MELSNRHEEDGGDIPMPMMIHHQEPISSSHNNNHHHHQMMNSNGNNINMNPNSSLDHHQDHENQQVVPYKKMTTMKYRECLKNHAAAIGGNATDGCGEFMPSGEEGTIEALTCSACNCHRNFHRKDVEDQTSSPSCDCFHSPQFPNRGQQRKMHLLSHHHHHHHNAILGPAPESLGYPTRPTPHHHQQMIMSYNMGFIPNSDQSDEQEEDIGGSLSRPAHHHHHHQQQLLKKRHRTKFSQEQKEKMLNFAEKVGWKFQKQEESIVQQFCQEIGVKRRVLKVWMHNNKHNLAKKNIMMNSIPQTTTNSLT